MSTLKSSVLLRSFCFVHNLAQSQPVYCSNYKPYYLVVYREYKGLSLFTGSNFKILSKHSNRRNKKMSQPLARARGSGGNQPYSRPKLLL